MLWRGFPWNWFLAATCLALVHQAIWPSTDHWPSQGLECSFLQVQVHINSSMEFRTRAAAGQHGATVSLASERQGTKRIVSDRSHQRKVHVLKALGHSEVADEEPSSVAPLLYLFASCLVTMNICLWMAPSELPYDVFLFMAGCLAWSLYYCKEWVLGAFVPYMFELIVLRHATGPPLFVYACLVLLLLSRAITSYQQAKDHRHVLILTIPSALIAAVGLACVWRFLLPYTWDWPLCFVFAAMLNGWDSRPVVGLLKKLGIPAAERQLVLVEALQNDISSIAIFCMALKVAIDGALWEVLELSALFCLRSLALCILGCVLGAAVLFSLVLARRAGNHYRLHVQLSVFVVGVCGAWALPASGMALVDFITPVISGCLAICAAWPLFLHPDSMAIFCEILEFASSTFIIFVSGVMFAAIICDTPQFLSAFDGACVFLIYCAVMGVRVLRIYLLYSASGISHRPLQTSQVFVAAWGSWKNCVVNLALAIIFCAEEHLTLARRAQIQFLVAGVVALSLTISVVFADLPFSFAGQSKATAGPEPAAMPLSHYMRHAFHTQTPPANPVWLYSTSRSFGQSTRLRSMLWFTFFVVPLVGMLWWVHSHGSLGLVDYSWRIAIMISLLVANFLWNVVPYALAPLPAKDPSHRNDPKYLARIGCIVPCHRSASEIVRTVETLLLFLKPEHIVVVDNGCAVCPLDETPQRISALNPKVVYMWVPVGMKTNALWMGLARLPAAVDFVMHIDDDTELPEDFVFDAAMWEHKATSAISYGITMKQDGLVERLVDLEFKLISHHRAVQSKFATVWFQHGIIGIWRRDAFLETLQEHPFLPFGEDNWNGVINLLKNRQMRQEFRSHVTTYAPATLFPWSGSREQGYGAANLYKQRAERWCVNAPRRFHIRLYLFFSFRHETLLGNIFFKVESLIHLVNIVVHLDSPIYISYALINGQLNPILVCRVMCVYFILQLLQGFLFNYVFWRHRKDLQVRVSTLLLRPLYDAFLIVCTVIGHWRCLLYYIPFFPMRHGLYTEGNMTRESLKALHGIETLDADYTEPSKAPEDRPSG